MGKDSGAALYVAFQSVDLSGAARNFSTTIEQESADATAYSDNFRNTIATKKTAGASLEVFMPTDGGTVDAINAVIQVGDEGTLEWAVFGTAAGNPKWGMYCRVKKADQDIPMDDVVVISMEFENIGTDLVYDGSTAVYS